MHKLQRVASSIICRQFQPLARLQQHQQQQNSSQYKRPQIRRLSEDTMQELKLQLLQDGHKPSDTEWHAARETLIANYRHINEHNVDVAMLGICNEATHMAHAKNYVQYLNRNGKEPNVATLGRLLKVYHLKYVAAAGTTEDAALSAAEQTEIMQIYADIRKKYDVLDATTCENLIHGLVATDNWRDALELLDMMKLSAEPSLNAYNVLVVKAFRMRNFELGWRILQDMVAEGRQPRSDVYMMYFEASAKLNASTFVKHCEQLLQFLGENELVLTHEVSQYLCQLAERLPHLLRVTPAKLQKGGKCSYCAQSLQNICITTEDFQQLSDSFLQKVLIRNDVFQKSTPAEVERFKRYVEETVPYDCVIDGLNVAYSMGAKRSPAAMANLVADVVKYFVQQRKKVLILGRKHMNSWPKAAMTYIRRNASVFLTNNLTHDDPFLLYATLKSGQKTDFFSRDYMRSHAYLLGPELKVVFRRWQQEHQYSLVTQTQHGEIIVKQPIRYVIYAHKVADTWHVPIKPEYSPHPADTFELPKNWLCINFQNVVAA